MSPCTPACEFRNAECRKYCEVFKAYNAEKQEEYKKRELDRVADDTMNEHIIAVKKKYRRTVWQR